MSTTVKRCPNCDVEGFYNRDEVRCNDCNERLINMEVIPTAELAALQSENRFLSGVISGMENTDNEQIAALRTRAENAEAALSNLFMACSKLCIDDMNKIEAEINQAAAALKGDK